MKFLFVFLFCSGTAFAQSGSFVGVWQTTYGRMRLTERKPNDLAGFYTSPRGTIDGKLKDRRFTFQYDEGDVKGEGWFELALDGRTFAGQWRPSGTQEWKEWKGLRLPAIPNIQWLVVVEANWGNTLEDREYAFGDMLKTFFDRTSHVEVRRRSFTDAESLKQTLREVALFPEPTIVTIASHGETDGLKVGKNTIDAKTVSEGLKDATNLTALHFSSCLVMKKNFGKEVSDQLKKYGVKTSVSGYQRSFDWAGSALFEMTYFDMMLERDMGPAEASKAALKLFPIAGDAKLAGIPIEPGGFKVLN